MRKYFTVALFLIYSVVPAQNNPVEKPGRLGLLLNVGTGFDRINTFIETDKGDMVYMSGGGGRGIGIQLGYAAGRIFGLRCEILYQSSGFQPYLKNASGRFSRGIFNPSGFFILNLDKLTKMNIGAGANVIFNPKCKIDARQIPQGALAEVSYNTVIAPSLFLEFERFLSSSVSFTAGLKAYFGSYSVKSFNKDGSAETVDAIPNTWKTVNAGGAGLAMGVILHL